MAQNGEQAKRADQHERGDGEADGAMEQHGDHAPRVYLSNRGWPREESGPSSRDGVGRRSNGDAAIWLMHHAPAGARAKSGIGLKILRANP